jgi:hypothetical protein
MADLGASTPCARRETVGVPAVGVLGPEVAGLGVDVVVLDPDVVGMGAEVAVLGARVDVVGMGPELDVLGAGDERVRAIGGVWPA